jgi:RNA polymerase-binding transcription factor DksA
MNPDNDSTQVARSMRVLKCVPFSNAIPPSIGEHSPMKLPRVQLISTPGVPVYLMAMRRSKQPSRRRRAATADVVGRNLQPDERVPEKWKKYYRRLVKLRDSLLSRQGDLMKDASEEQPSFSLHMADAGTDSFDRDLALSRLSAEQDAVYEIDEALMRIQRGTYGICELTGKPIDRDRLEAIPWTRFSAAAEKQLEKDGEVRRTRLAPREAIARGVNSSNEAAGSTDDEILQ